MRPRPLALALLLLPVVPLISALAPLSALSALSAFEAQVSAAPGVPQVEVVGPRVRLGDVMKAAPADVASLDLGAAPAVGGTRVVSREEIVAALTAAKAKVPAGVPDAVRVARKVKIVGAADLEKELRASLKTHPLAKGGSLVAVRPPKSIEVGAGWDRVVLDVPHPPRKSGSWSTTATLVFARGEETLGKVAIPIEVALPAAAAIPDVAQKAGITLVIERGQVEVSVRGTANVDGDVGEIIPITIPSGKVLRGRIATRERANCVEGT
jgi:hypothetical protein